MSTPFEIDVEDGPEYQLCSVNGSRLRFRGPLPREGQPFVAALGGNETFGKYVATPYPALLSDWLEYPVVNLGVAQAGLSLYSDESVLLDLASKADLTVFQVLGAQNMSNRLYSVHTRRNDRFLAVSPTLRNLFPTIDFAEINFTGHLLTRLEETSSESFEIVVEELKWAWLQRMRRILSMIESDVLMLWISDRAPQETCNHLHEEEPRFVDRAMIEALRDQVVGVVEVVLPQQASLNGKIFHDHEADAARMLPGPDAHARIAEALSSAVTRFLGGPGRSSLAARGIDQSFSTSSGTAVKRSATRP